MATAQPTTDHDAIREWVESRGGHPSRVKATGRRGDPGVLRIDFPGFSGEDTLEEIGWDEFFEWFDRDRLALLLSDEEGNRFNKFVRRTASRGGAKKATSAKKSSAKKSSAKKSGAKRAAVSSSKKSSSKSASSKKSVASKKSTSSKKAASSKKASASRKTSAKKATAGKKSSAKKTSSSKKTTARKAAPGRKASARKSSATKRSSSTSSVTTTNHDEIRKWVEARGGFPAHVKRTGRNRKDLGVLRIDYPGYSGRDTLERIDWDAWFDAFDSNKLAFLYQDKRNSRFSKLVAR